MNDLERDAVRHNLVGVMHNMVEGVAQHHLRRVWGVGLDYSGKTSRAGPNLEVKAAPSAAASERMDVDDADDDDERDGIDAEVTPLDIEAELAELAEERRIAGEELDDLTAPRKRRRTGLKLWLDVDYVSVEDADYAPESDAEDDEDGREASARLAKERRGVMQIAPAELQALRQGIVDVILPSWVARPPANLGEAAHGKLKADTLFVVFTVVIPFVFVMLWSSAAQRQRQMLANVMALVVSINIACSYSTSTEAADVFARDFKQYLETMLHLFPHAHLVPNHHLALYIADQLRDWGPIMALSEWFYERINGQLQRFKTNGHLGAVERPLCTALTDAVRRRDGADDAASLLLPLSLGCRRPRRTSRPTYPFTRRDRSRALSRSSALLAPRHGIEEGAQHDASRRGRIQSSWDGAGQCSIQCALRLQPEPTTPLERAPSLRRQAAQPCAVSGSSAPPLDSHPAQATLQAVTPSCRQQRDMRLHRWRAPHRSNH